jgi:hypothetical protein
VSKNAYPVTGAWLFARRKPPEGRQYELREKSQKKVLLKDAKQLT